MKKTHTLSLAKAKPEIHHTDMDEAIM